MSAFLIGATGLVGKSILKQLDQSAAFESVTTLTRRELETDVSPKVQSIVEQDSHKWQDTIRSTKASTFFSAFGTTRVAAGGMENFVKIDYGINYDAAKAAKEAGVKTCVLVSSAGANTKSWIGYLRSKGKLDEDVIALEFDRTIILRPGPLLGEREKPKNFANKVIARFGSSLKSTPFSMGACYDYEVAGAAVKLASKPLGSEREVIILTGGEIVKASN